VAILDKDNKNDKNELLDILRTLIQQIKEKRGLTKDELLGLLEEEGTTVPLYVFSTPLGPLEALVKFLKEERNLKFSEIASILGRDNRSIWSSYRHAIAKIKNPLSAYAKESKKKKADARLESLAVIPIDAGIFSDRKLSVFEHLVAYLKETKGISVADISKIVNRSNGTVWATYHNAKVKLKA